MKAVFISFKQLFLQIRKDKMLILICFAPMITGIAFKFGLPNVEYLLCEHFGKITIIKPYYLMIDILLAVLTPNLFCFASAMVILEEKDTNIIQSLCISPLGKKGYLISRLVLPAVVSTAISLIIVNCFSLTEIKFWLIVLLSILSAVMGLMVALLIVSFSKNKVEGIALAKLGGLFMLGTPIPCFMDTTKQYFACFLPSFWVSKFMIDFSFYNISMSVVVVAIWIYFFSRVFINKIN